MKRLSILFALLLSGQAHVAFGQAYPNKPIRLVVPFPAGESVDVLARIIVQQWQTALGQQILVDNRGGAGGTIGTEIVAKAAADGYTISYGNLGPLSIGPNLYKKLGYDLFRDLAPVSQATNLPMVLFASLTLQANSMAELVAYAKSHPGELNFGSTGIGSGIHLMTEMFKMTAGVDVVHVPYKGVSQALPEMIAGRLQLTFNSIPSFLQHVKAGRLKALVITASNRSPLLPEVPACTEVGMPGLDVPVWHAVVAPAGTPQEVVRKLHQTLAQTLALREIREQLIARGAEPVGSSPEEFGKFLRVESDRWAGVIKHANVKVE